MVAPKRRKVAVVSKPVFNLYKKKISHPETGKKILWAEHPRIRELLGSGTAHETIAGRIQTIAKELEGSGLNITWDDLNVLSQTPQRLRRRTEKKVERAKEAAALKKKIDALLKKGGHKAGVAGLPKHVKQDFVLERRRSILARLEKILKEFGGRFPYGERGPRNNLLAMGEERFKARVKAIKARNEKKEREMQELAGFLKKRSMSAGKIPARVLRARLPKSIITIIEEFERETGRKFSSRYWNVLLLSERASATGKSRKQYYAGMGKRKARRTSKNYAKKMLKKRGIDPSTLDGLTVSPNKVRTRIKQFEALTGKKWQWSAARLGTNKKFNRVLRQHLNRKQKRDVLKAMELLRQAVPDEKTRKKIVSQLTLADLLERWGLFSKTGLKRIGEGKFFAEKKLNAWGKFARRWLDGKGRLVDLEILKKKTVPALISKSKTAAP